MKVSAIDAFDFGRAKEHRRGELALADLSRLAEECADSSGTLRWSVVGGTHASGHLQLFVKVDGVVRLFCQRCLKAFDFDLSSASTLILAKDEDAADEIEEMLDDESLDVIVGSKEMELRDLVEDEALLAIPQSPKHADCSVDAAATTEQQSGEPEPIVVKLSPFAILKDLKH